MLVQFAVKNFYYGNYQWQIARALDAGDNPRALQIAQKQYARESYDFAAHRWLAKAFVANGEPDRAAKILETSLDRGRTAIASGAYIVGYSQGETAKLLSEVLSSANRPIYAAEMCRYSADEEGTSAIGCSSVGNTEITTAPEAVQWYESSEFQLSEGVSVTSGGLLFDRNATATLAVPHVQSGDRLWLEIRSDKVMGMGGLLSVSLGEQILTQVYGNSPDSRLIAVLVPTLSPVPSPLTLRFLNDAFESLTGADRNFEVIRVGFETQARKESHIEQ